MINRQQLAKSRSQFYQQIRNFFHKDGFIEVETPIMVAKPGMEPHLTPFESSLTTPQAKKHPVYLNTSPELQMKKLLGEGFERIFTITKTFRNGEIGGGLHNPEFTMLEWYRQEANYLDIMTDCENLIKALGLSSPFQRLSINEAFIQHTGINLEQHKTYEQLKQTTEALGLNTSACQTWDDLFFKIMLNKIEPNLPQTPIFLYDYPASQAALARKKAENPFWAERFELYIQGLEIANAFSELIDAEEQRTRLEEERALRQELKKTVFPIDEEFLASLESIQHPSAGVALGLDRLLMVLLDQKHIEDVLLFPMTTML